MSKEPTIDEAIAWQKGCLESAGLSYKGFYEFAIRALEEMREQKDTSTNKQKALDRLVKLLAIMGPEAYANAQEILNKEGLQFNLGNKISNLFQSAPRTWRDVTLGEVYDKYDSVRFKFESSWATLPLYEVGLNVLGLPIPMIPDPLRFWRAIS